MITASVAQTKNGLSALLRQVRHGKTVVVTDRGEPIAQIVPIAMATYGPKLQELVRAGLVSPPISQNVYAGPTVDLTGRGSLSEAVLSEREEGW